MTTPTPDVTWAVAGIIVAVIVGLGKRFKWVPDDRITKQLSAFVVAVLTCLAWPLLQGEAIPALGVLAMSIVQTWLTAMASYSVYQTANETIQPKAKPA